MSTEERSKFLLEHSEKCLIATIADAEALGQNCIYTAGVFLAALGACGAVIVKSDQTYPELIASLISGAYLMICTRRFVNSALSARGIKLPGNLASHLSKPPFGEMVDSELFKLEAEGYDKRICENAERNKETGKGLNRAIRDLLLFPGIFLGTWLVVKSLTLFL